MVTAGLIAITLIAGAAALPAVRARAWKLVRPRADIAARLAELAPARERVRAAFAQAGVAYPPRRMTIVGFKHERRLDVFAAGEDGTMRWVLEYPILGASGSLGPKLREGDKQVPEGVYSIESLNPNSLYHVALRVGYPSDEDRSRAKVDGRTRLGGDIMIHGGTGSVGCLAMGDAAAEDLFVLSADVGVERIEVLLCPVDWRRADALVETAGMPAWVPERYQSLRERLSTLPGR